MSFASFANWRFEYLTIAGTLQASSRRLINEYSPRQVWRLDSRERSSELASDKLY